MNASELQSFLDDMAFFRDVDTIQELSNILILNKHRLLDRSCRLRHQLDVVSRQDDLVLLSRRDLDRHTVQHRNTTGVLITKEVADLNEFLIVRDVGVDGEVSIDKSHLVLKALGDSLDHVVDVRADSPDGSIVLSLAVMHSHSQLVLGSTLDLQVNMLELLGKFSSWSLD